MILRIHLNRAMINVKTKCQARADGMTIKSKWPKIEVPAILIDFEQCCNAPNDTRLPNFKWDDGMHLFKACKESLLWDASLKHPRIFLYPHRITCFSGKWHAGPMWSHFVCLQPTSRISVPPPTWAQQLRSKDTGADKVSGGKWFVLDTKKPESWESENSCYMKNTISENQKVEELEENRFKCFYLCIYVVALICWLLFQFWWRRCCFRWFQKRPSSWWMALRSQCLEPFHPGMLCCMLFQTIRLITRWEIQYLPPCRISLICIIYA